MERSAQDLPIGLPREARPGEHWGEVCPLIPPMLGPVAAIVGTLAPWAGVTALIFLGNKLDKRFGELKAEPQGNRAEVRALREAVLSVKT